MADVDLDKQFQNLKDNLRIDDSTDDEIKMLRDTAIDTLVGSIGGSRNDEFYKNNNRFNLAVQMLTDMYYRQKSATSTSKESITKYGVQTFILQLKPDYHFWKEAQDANSQNG